MTGTAHALLAAVSLAALAGSSPALGQTSGPANAEATNAAALVTPYILEYGDDHPEAYGLLAIPAYVGAARLKNHAHWQSDILAGWGLGAASGYYAYSRDVPLLVSILPRGITVGLRREF